jgi:hypothetical protein
MKKLLLLIALLASCTPVRRINVHSRHNYYEKHRATTYTVPVFIPGKGVVLETHTVPKLRPTRKSKN